MNAQDEKQDTLQSAAYNPFPEPQTIPSGWDTSVFSFVSQSVLVERPDDSAENKSNEADR